MTTPTAKSSARASDTGLPQPQRLWAMVAIAVSLTLAVLDSAMVNVALPTIARDLEITPAASVWVVKAYQLAIIGCLLPLASLGESIGYKRIYVVGVLVFSVASLACALADSLGMLIAARVVQGLGAAGIMSVNTALVRFIFPRHALGRGLGITVLVVATSASAGPTVAAGILAVADWNWLFAVHVPLGLVAFVLAARLLPATPKSKHPLDVISAILNILTFCLLILSVNQLGQSASPVLAGLLFLGTLVCGSALVHRQASLPAPLMPVDLLRIPLFAVSIITSISSFTAQMLAFVALPFYFQDVLGRTPVETGLLMTPWAVLVAVTAPVAGRLADRHAAGLLGSVGLVVVCVGLMLLASLPASASSVDIMWRMALCGFGFAVFQSPNNRAIISSAPIERSGGASGMLGTARLTGQALGAALAALALGWSDVNSPLQALFLAAGFAGSAAILSSLRLFRGLGGR